MLNCVAPVSDVEKIDSIGARVSSPFTGTSKKYLSLVPQKWSLLYDNLSNRRKKSLHLTEHREASMNMNGSH